MPETSALKSNTVLVSRMLGDSYSVVKEVYNNLDVIKALNENENIETLLNNYEELKAVLDQVDTLKEISDNMDAITSAEGYAARAQAYATQAENTLTELNEQADNVSDLLTQCNEVMTSITEAQTNLTDVISNLDAIIAVNENAETINTLAEVFTDEDQKEAIDKVASRISSIQLIADNFDYIKEMVNTVLNKSTLDRLEDALDRISEVDNTCTSAIESMKEQITEMEKRTSEFSSLVQSSESSYDSKVEEAEASLNSIKTSCDDILTKCEEYYNQCVDLNADCNRILLKVRDLYHEAEESIQSSLQEGVTDIMTEADSQVRRIKVAGDHQANRLLDLMDKIIETTADGMQAKADEIAESTLDQIEDKANQALEDLQSKIDEATASFNEQVEQINTKLEEIEDHADQCLEDTNAAIEQAKTDLADLKDALIEEINSAADAKLEEIAQYIVETKYGDIIWGYEDYSLEENQEDMVVGVTYINAWDDDGYIQISEDSNSFEREPVYIRFYIKSQSGTVTYLQKKVKFDINDLLAATTENKGIVELATIVETRAGTDTERAVTPNGLYEALPVLMQAVFNNNEDGTTNNVIEVLIETIRQNVHLQESLIEAITDVLKEKVLVDYATLENLKSYAKLSGAGFTGEVTVPSQSEEIIDAWEDDVVLNRGDIVKMVEYMQNHGEITSVNLVEDTNYEDVDPSSDVDFGQLNFYPAGDLL